MGNPSTSNNGHRPIAISHWARVQVCHQRQGPNRPPKVKINMATAAKDSQNPGCRLASGSINKIPLSASNSGHQAPR
ncbi:hypothetical protein D3C81_1107160 [compost metagenome]